MISKIKSMLLSTLYIVVGTIVIFFCSVLLMKLGFRPQ